MDITTDWQSLPGSMGDEHIFAVGDIHGEAGVLQRALDHVASVEKQAPSHFISLGDLIDRGEEGIRATNLAFDAQRLAGVDKATVLPGNHELMLMDGLRFARANMPEDAMFMLENWLRNGGLAVVDEAGIPLNKNFDVSNLEDMVRDQFPADYEATLYSQSHVKSGDLIFVHAGLDASGDNESFLEFDQHGGYNNWAWIRDGFLNFRGGWDDDKKLVVVHGHTPCIGIEIHNRDHLERTDIDLVGSHRRINLDVGTGKATTQVVVAEFLNGQYRLTLVQA